MTIRIVGGGGGIGGALLGVEGGNGASGTGTITVVPGEILRLTVAGGGKNGICDGCGDVPGGGGGGASSIVNLTTNTVMVVAGGGGGTGSRASGTDATIGRGGDAGTGVGGGNGSDGRAGAHGHTGGAGGTQGGTGGAGGATNAGAPGITENGGAGVTILSTGGSGGGTLGVTDGGDAQSDSAEAPPWGDAGGGGAGVAASGNGTGGAKIQPGGDRVGIGGSGGGGAGGWASGGGGAGYAGGGGGAGSFLQGGELGRGGGGGGGGSSFGAGITFTSVVPDHTTETSAYGEGAYRYVGAPTNIWKDAGNGVIELTFVLPATAASTNAVPTMSLWSLLGLSGCFGAWAVSRRRRQHQG